MPKRSRADSRPARRRLPGPSRPRPDPAPRRARATSTPTDRQMPPGPAPADPPDRSPDTAAAGRPQALPARQAAPGARGRRRGSSRRSPIGATTPPSTRPPRGRPRSWRPTGSPPARRGATAWPRHPPAAGRTQRQTRGSTRIPGDPVGKRGTRHALPGSWSQGTATGTAGHSLRANRGERAASERRPATRRSGAGHRGRHRAWSRFAGWAWIRGTVSRAAAATGGEAGVEASGRAGCGGVCAPVRSAWSSGLPAAGRA